MRPGRGSPLDGGQACYPVQVKVLDDIRPDFHWGHALNTKINGPAMTVLGVGGSDRAGTIPEGGILVTPSREVIVDRDRLSVAIPNKLRHLHDLRIDEPDGFVNEMLINSWRDEFGQREILTHFHGEGFV